ncbi:MAG: c-type cytochrome [Legionellaceae bacterium]|nr:c-type cytochrome [Legionellaceae bacterium]
MFSGLIYATGSDKSGAEKSVICGACHGQEGISISPEWPNLAGQHQKYLIKELYDLKLGKTRNEPTMIGMLANLTPQDIEDLAAFYSKKSLPQPPASQKSYARGEEIYKSGDMKSRITACIACHGPDGRGNEDAGFPVLSGQNPKYTVKQLHAFKNKMRTNDISSIMHIISLHMSDEDMEAVANYIYQLR